MNKRKFGWGAVALWAAVVFIVSGAISAAMIASMLRKQPMTGEGGLTIWQNANEESVEFDFSADLPSGAELDVDLFSLTVVIEPDASLTGKMSAHFKGTRPAGDARHVVTCEQEQNKLVFRQQPRFNVNLNPVLRPGLRGTLTIRVPADGFSKADVRVSSGEITLGALRLHELELHASSGDIWVSPGAEVSGDALIRVTSGGVLLDGGRYGSLTLGVSSGNIRFTDETDILGKLTATATSGDMAIRASASDASLRCSSGAVRYEALAQGNIEARVTSGDITLVLPSLDDTGFDLSVTSGDLSFDGARVRGHRFDRPGGAHKITVSASSGSIEVVRR